MRENTVSMNFICGLHISVNMTTADYTTHQPIMTVKMT